MESVIQQFKISNHYYKVANHQMNSSVFREEAIPLVIFNNEKRIFEINDDAFDFLKALPSPLGIISVAGMYRTGKSYLLNRMLLNRSGGFGVGPTINPCTKGVWVWGKPIQGFTPDGDPINVLVIDTEGIGALDEDSNHDVRIFSLAILLSSFFIYNSVGSIDESALSNLSLVINLTKHIHLKSTGISEDIDPEEYSQYFPSFMWVVRDFALQLVDLEGEPLTSKEYLEKALQPQKGYSDGVEQKNRIRRMMKSFFKERDCCTMIRPLTKEENLQTLEKMDLDELRPEFVEQVMQLRRKVINRIKPKMMHDRKLNGEMLYNLALSYVEAINRGAVPNIESAWSYICKNECQKAQYEAQGKFEKSLTENFELRCPLFDDELREIYKDARKLALEEFSKVAVGEVQRQFLVELKDRMKQKFKQVKQENEKISEEQCLMFLQQNYVDIEKNLKNQMYGSVFELVDEIKNFQNHFIENGPPGPNRFIVLYDFCYKSLAEASEFFFRTIANELLLQKQINEDTLHKLQAEIKDMKEENKKKIDYFETKLRSIESEKAEISANEQAVREKYAQVAKEKSHLEAEMNEKFEQLKRESARQIEEYKHKVYQSEEGQKEIQRTHMAAESEHDKQKALLEQKIEFFEKQLESAQKNEKELGLEVKNLKREHMVSAKEIQKQYEGQNNEIRKKLEDFSEKVFEWESKYQELEQKYDQDSLRWEDQEQILKKELAKLRESTSELTKQNDVLKKKLVDEVDSLKQYTVDEVQQKNELIQDLEQRLKLSEETFEMAKSKWDKDLAIFKQKQEFLDFQLKEEKLKNEEQRQSHDLMIRNIQSRERESVIGKEESSKRIEQLKDQYTQELQEMEAKFEQTRLRLTQSNDQFQEKNAELELSLKIQVADFEKEILQLKEQLSSAEEYKIKSQDLLKNMDSQKLKLLQESDSRHIIKENELEREIEEKTREFEDNIREVQQKSEEQLAQLKQFYEQEKERLEKRLQEDKERAQKRYNNMVDDYEYKLKEEQSQREEDVNGLEEEMRQMENNKNNLIQQLEHEINLREQSIDSLSKQLADTKESLNKIQNMSSSAMEQQLDKFNEERNLLNQKIDRITIELTQKERVITTLENQKESLQNQMNQKEKTISEMRKETNTEKSDLGDKIEQMRLKQQETLDELTQRKIEFEREKALKSQQLQFQEQRIGELSKQLEDTIRRYDERLKQEREDLQKDMQEKVARVTQEKEVSDMKYEQKRKALKDLESNINKQISGMEREKAVLLEKYQNLEQSQKELMKNYEAEMLKFKETNEQLSRNMTLDKQAIHDEVEKWRNQFLDMERQFQDLNNNYDKDKALWDGKFKFLEQQKDQAKKDFEEAQKKFQSTVEQIQKAQAENKAKTENSHMNTLSQMEQKYQSRIKEVQENGQVLYQELQKKTKQLERENKQLQERWDMSTKSKMSEQGGLEKKVEKLLEEKDRLQDEVESVKTERDNKIMEYQKLLDKERETYKQKLRDTEGKGTRVEVKQTELMLGFEKERAKWEHEKSFLMSQKDDATENAQRFEKKVEQLLRENEKLKNDIKNSRKTMYQASANTNSYQAAIVGSKLIGNLGLGAYKAGSTKDVMETQRSTYQLKDSALGTSVLGEKSLVSQSLNWKESGISQGAVGGFGGGGLESSLIKNILSTPSSSKLSDERSYKTSSPDDQRRGE